jgi:flagellar L-ring protein precursor FlgH
MLTTVLAAGLASQASAQTSSIGKRAEDATRNQTTDDGNAASHERREYQGNALLEAHSLIAVPVMPPREFKKHDIITIIVRHQKKFEAEGELEQRKKFEIQSELDAFFKFFDDGIGAAAFRRGKPNVDYEFETRLRNEGDNAREDTFITRISGFIVDVKPNGNLVIEAKGRIRHEEEESVVTVTGLVRSNDVTPDNTVLSTQIANLEINVDNKGAVRDAATRGWVTRLLDFLKPI